MYEYNGGLINRRVRAFFIPSLLVSLMITLSMFLDILLVGRMVGPTQMGAIQMALPVTMSFNMLYMLFGTGGEVLVAAAKGAQDPHEADRVFCVTMAFVVCLSTAIAILGASSATAIAGALAKGNAQMTPLVAQYLRVMFIGCPLFICVMSCSSFVKADALPNLAASIAIVANIVNIASKMVYMGPMKMGLTGAAAGTITGYSVGLAILAACWIFSRKRRVLNFVMPKAADFSRLGNIFLTGLPSSLGQGVGALVSWAGNALILSVAGRDGIVAMTVANSCIIFLSAFRYASAMTIIPLVGAMFGARDWWSMLQTARRVMLICIVCTVICIVPLALFPVPVIALFGAKEPSIITMGATALRFFAVNLILSVIIHILMTYYQVTGRKTLAIVLSAAIEGVDFGVKLLFVNLFGTPGLWLSAIPSSLVILGLTFCAARYIEHATKGKELSYHGLFLLHERNLPFAQSNTIRPTAQDAIGFADMTRAFVEQNGIAPAMAEKAKELVKQAALAIIAKNAKHNKSIDIMTVIWKGAVMIRLRDDGPKFAAEAQENGAIRHAAIMGYNDTSITVAA